MKRLEQILQNKYEKMLYQRECQNMILLKKRWQVNQNVRKHILKLPAGFNLKIKSVLYGVGRNCYV